MASVSRPAGHDRLLTLQSSRPKECNTGAMVIDSPELDQVSSGGKTPSALEIKCFGKSRRPMSSPVDFFVE